MQSRISSIIVGDATIQENLFTGISAEEMLSAWSRNACPAESIVKARVKVDYSEKSG
jgi:hypothetical protein